MSDQTDPSPPAGASEHDQHFMARAVELAERGLFTTHPNPRVGCVIVKDHAIVGEGWHRAAGGPHAEVNALASAGARAHGATAYVTLEPCSHHGRTPPCAEALVSAGIRRVVIANPDPNPLVDGQGLDGLRAAGIALDIGVEAVNAAGLNPGFLTRMRTGRPWVRLKLAMSLDGKTALANGDSNWITGPEARNDVQYWRARSSTVATGIGTVLQDDPRLNVRPEALTSHERRSRWEPATDPNGPAVLQPTRVVVDTRGRFPLTAAMRQCGGPIVVATTAAGQGQHPSLQAAGLETETVGGDRGRVALPELIDRLGERGENEVLFECGATLAGSLIEQRLIDELVLYVAPCLLGSAGRPLADLPSPERMAERWDLELNEVRRFGNDVRLTFRA